MSLKMYPDQPPVKKPLEIAPWTFRHGENKLLFFSLGCPLNRVDTEVMLGILLKAGYEPTGEVEDADYIIVNTCGFLEAARAESLATIDEMYQERKKGTKIM